MGVEYLSPEEVNAFLAAAEEAGGRDELVCRMLLYTGMRVGELGAMTCSDVDLRRGALTLNKVLITPHMLGMEATHETIERKGKNPRTGRKWSLRPAYAPQKEMGILLCDKNRKMLTGEKVLGLPADLLKKFPSGELVKEGLKARHPVRLVPLTDRPTLMRLEEWTKGRPGREFLWLSQKGGRLNVTGLHRLVETVLLAAKVTEWKEQPHILPQTFAVTFLKKTLDLAQLSRILGHTDNKTTTIYLAFVFEDLKEAMGRAGDIYAP